MQSNLLVVFIISSCSSLYSLYRKLQEVVRLFSQLIFLGDISVIWLAQETVETLSSCRNLLVRVQIPGVAPFFSFSFRVDSSSWDLNEVSQGDAENIFYFQAQILVVAPFLKQVGEI